MQESQPAQFVKQQPSWLAGRLSNSRGPFLMHFPVEAILLLLWMFVLVLNASQPTQPGTESMWRRRKKMEHSRKVVLGRRCRAKERGLSSVSVYLHTQASLYLPLDKIFFVLFSLSLNAFFGKYRKKVLLQESQSHGKYVTVSTVVARRCFRP